MPSSAWKMEYEQNLAGRSIAILILRARSKRLAYRLPLVPDLRRTVKLFFNDTATTEIYTLSLHDALPIYGSEPGEGPARLWRASCRIAAVPSPDRKSTRLNSSHLGISYAVFCLKEDK